MKDCYTFFFTRWFKHPIRMTSRLLPVEVFQGYLKGTKPQDKPRTR